MPLPVPLRFGVTQAYGSVAAVDAANAFIAATGARLGQALELVVAQSYDALVELVGQGSVQLAWMPPLAHARATAHGATLAGVVERHGALTFRAVVLVRQDSVHVTASGLRGVRLAWTDPASASGWLYPRLHLLAGGLDPARDIADERFHGSTFAACAAVAAGQADVCACYVRASAAGDPDLALADVERVFPGARTQFRVLDLTDLIPPDGLVLSGLDAEAQAAVTAALLSLHEDDAGRAALAALLEADRIVPVTDEVRRLIARLRAHVHV